MNIYSILIFDVTRERVTKYLLWLYQCFFVDEHSFYIINGNKSEKVTHWMTGWYNYLENGDAIVYKKQHKNIVNIEAIQFLMMWLRPVLYRMKVKQKVHQPLKRLHTCAMFVLNLESVLKSWPWSKGQSEASGTLQLQHVPPRASLCSSCLCCWPRRCSLAPDMASGGCHAHRRSETLHGLLHTQGDRP